MTQDKNIPNRYTAEPGMWITNDQGIYTDEIWLGIQDNITNWRDATNEEYEAFEESQRKLLMGEQYGENS